MGVIHRYRDHFDWEDVPLGNYPTGKQAQGVSVRRLIGRAENAHNFALRYFEIEPGGWSALDQHAHDHGVTILRGQGQVRLDEELYEIGFGDVVYIPPFEVHQFHNTGDEPLGFLCIIPPKEKS
jgi:quercetin dioxygenase-like cupin family protein